LRIGAAARQPEDGDRLIGRDPAVLFGGVLISIDLCGHGCAESKALGDDFAGKLLEAVLHRRVEVTQRLEQAQRDDGVNRQVGVSGKRVREQSVRRGLE
jgi:hypothetical protein